MYNSNTPFKPKPDTGTLRAQGAKKFPNSPDYWGDIHVNMKDLTNINIEDGCHVIKISGWKRIDKQGKTYLSLSVKRLIPQAEGGVIRQEDQRQDFSDEDIPF
jgi:hypothetical protein